VNLDTAGREKIPMVATPVPNSASKES